MKVIEFDENNIPKIIIDEVIKNEIKDKIKCIKVNGCEGLKISVHNYNISIASYTELSKTQIAKCKKIFNDKSKSKIEKVTLLIKRCDFIFSDLKSYHKLKNSFAEASYCSVETELESLIKKYVHLGASSYYMYRVRNANFNKIGCM